jgi:hypothetical protein
VLRWSNIAILVVLIGSAGCPPQPPTAEPMDEGIKIGELAPKTDKPRQAKFLVTAAIDVHVFDLPAANVDKLDDVWDALSTKSIWMTNYEAFRRNAFRVRSGRLDAWRRIPDLLAKAGAQKVGTATLMVNDKDSTDWPIVNSPGPTAVSFVDENLLTQTANLGPGRLVLRLRTEPVPGARGVRKLIAYPAYTLPVSSAIPELQEKLKESEFIFRSAAFAAQMGPGDIVVLAPDEYTGERLTLGGRFFNRAEPVTFLNPDARQFPRQEPAVRVLVLVCTDIRD